ncbi:MAG: VCBS repeat-containing protein, partial [Planctomycetes bacterium]|nr:VCBS repeat-containing protein [Planctomycetota bacterium]
GLALATSLTVDHIITDLEVGDFDGDGDRDFAIAWSVPSFIAMSEDVFIQPFFQEPGMLFSPGLVRHATSFNFVPSPLPVVLSVGIDLFRASVDGDAIDDLQLVVREPHMSTDTLFSWLGSASGVLLNAGIAPLDTTNATVAFADLDQDGKDELLQSDSTQFCARSVLGSPLPTPTQTIVDLSFVRPKAFIGRGWTISPIFELRDLATGTPLPGQTLSVAFTQPGGTTTTTTFTTDALGRIVVQPAPGPTAGRGTLLVAGALAATLVRETSTYVFDVVHNANPPVGSPFVSVRFRVETGQAALMTLVSDLPTPPTSTPFGTLYTSILAPAPSLAAIDGLGLFGPWNPAGIAAPEFFQLFTVPAGIPPGFTLVVQNYALDLSQPWPHSLVISPERTLVF